VQIKKKMLLHETADMMQWSCTSKCYKQFSSSKGLNEDKITQFMRSQDDCKATQAAAACGIQGAELVLNSVELNRIAKNSNSNSLQSKVFQI